VRWELTRVRRPPPFYHFFLPYRADALGLLHGGTRHVVLSEGDEDEREPWWIVFFAPSSASHVMPALRAHFSLAARESSPSFGESKLRRARLAAIGPTTEACLHDELGLRVDAVAEAPNADSLAIALLGKSTTE
jgi:uroporphyrinogen-III synthase